MDLTTQRRCLTLLAGGLFAGAVASVVWSLSDVTSQPLTQSIPGDGTEVVDANDGSEPTNESIPLLALRKPLIDTPPTAAPAPPTPRPVQPPPRSRLDLTLVGTIIDPLQSLAIVVDPSGKFDVKGVGESLELEPAGVKIRSIDSEQVTLEYQGTESTVKLDRSKKAGKRAAVGGTTNRSGGRNRGNRP